MRIVLKIDGQALEVRLINDEGFTEDSDYIHLADLKKALEAVDFEP